MLASKNGFYPVGSALLARPVGGPLDVFEWNSEPLWRHLYGEPATRLFFFADNLFGGQFAVLKDRIVTFNRETGDVEDFAASIDDWAGQILQDFDYLTGYPLAKKWTAEYGAIAAGTADARGPFVADGEFDISNLVSVAHRLPTPSRTPPTANRSRCPTPSKSTLTGKGTA